MRQRKWVRAVAVVIGTTSVAGFLAVETPAAAGAASPVSRPAAAVRPMSARPDPGDGGGCSRRCWAHWVVFRGSPPLEFYRHVKRHPRGTARFDFSTDGCSAPGWLDNVPLAGGIVREHKRKFRRACLIHDFGYRNFGPGEIGLQWWRMTDKQQSWGLHGAQGEHRPTVPAVDVPGLQEHRRGRPLRCLPSRGQGVLWRGGAVRRLVLELGLTGLRRRPPRTG